MKRHIFAVCDLERSYAHRFMEYLNQKKHIPFEIQAFTSTEHLLKFAEAHPIEILLISSGAVTPQVEKLAVGQLIVLSDGEQGPRLEQYPSVYKYQSSDAVLREVMNCYGEEGQEQAAFAACKPRMEILGIYSPLGGIGKTSFALTLGQLLAEEKAALYLNLEEYSGFETLFSCSFERNLGDLLYFLRRCHTNFIHKLHGAVQTVNRLDYLPPALSPEDLLETSWEQWEEFLDVLEEQSAYETLILDLGDGIFGLQRILERCDRIFMPIRQDLLSQGKVRQFENSLRIRDGIPVLEKIQKLSLPPCHSSDLGGDAKQLPWSELGDFVRELMRKEDL